MIIKLNRKHNLLLYWLLALTACTSDLILPAPADSVSITATAETDPVASSEDAADDPAIWINPSDTAQSLVIGTDKQFGLESYDLFGARQQRLAMGRTNNVDLRHLKNDPNWSAIAAASNRSSNSISLVLIDHDGALHWLKSAEVQTGLTEPYGLCMYRDDAGLQVFINDKDGRYQQWLLQTQLEPALADSVINSQLVREFKVNSQPEGCTADDAARRLFVGVEAEGVYWVEAESDNPSTAHLIAPVDSEILAADVEGMDLYLDGDEGYLVVSSQGSFSYAIFERNPPFRYRGSFVVAAGATLDGAEETDGLAISSELRTKKFPQGLLVVQDGFNELPSENQDFKLLSWQQLALALEL